MSSKVTLAVLKWPTQRALSNDEWSFILGAINNSGHGSSKDFERWWSQHFNKSLDWALLNLFRNTTAGLAWKGLHPNNSDSIELNVAHTCLEDWASSGLAELVLVSSGGKLGVQIRLANVLVAEPELALADIFWTLPSAVLSEPSAIGADPSALEPLRYTGSLAVLPPSPGPQISNADATYEAGVSFLDWRDPANTPPCALNETDPFLKMTTYFPPESEDACSQVGAGDRYPLSRSRTEDDLEDVTTDGSVTDMLNAARSFPLLKLSLTTPP
ncbi:hypothetical protein OC846_001263 [Tilletia horrida]|uniref:Uncharacterized protein n=1 Tax=Tilletia horrida TaxID=155126 RepID=A0AAN6GWN8_9BASI|nr:hypothetical protein OC846_001263 [Tilletia horrida]